MATLSNWTEITRIPQTFVRELSDGTYRISTYGGDDEGDDGPDDDQILQAIRHELGIRLVWASGSEWDVTNEAVAGEVVRAAVLANATESTTYSTRRHTAAGLETTSTYDSIDEALDARQEGEVVYHDDEDRELTEREIFG